jgi:hypothetical protein
VQARAESYTGRGRWGYGSPVRTMTGWSGKGWRRRARAAAKEQRRAERKQKGTLPRRGSYVEDKGAARTRRWQLHTRHMERRWRAGRQRRCEVTGGRPCHHGVDALTRTRMVRDTRSWAGVDSLVASGPNRHQAVLCSGPGPASFCNFNDFHSPKFEIRNGDILVVHNSLNFA